MQASSVSWEDWREKGPHVRRSPIELLQDPASAAIALPENMSIEAGKKVLWFSEKIEEIFRKVPDKPLAIPNSPSKKYYNRRSTYFNSSYFFKNLYKSLLTIEILRHRIDFTSSKIDLGCGAADFTCAFLSYLGDCSQDTNLHFDLIDRSKSQIKLAKKIIRSTYPKAVCKFHLEDISRYKIVSSGNFISSYFLGEFCDYKDVIEVLFQGCETFLAVDDPSVIQDMLTIPSGKRCLSGHVEFFVSGKLEELIEGSSGKFGYLYLHHDASPF